MRKFQSLNSSRVTPLHHGTCRGTSCETNDGIMKAMVKSPLGARGSGETGKTDGDTALLAAATTDLDTVDSEDTEDELRAQDQDIQPGPIQV
ncbi:hypothetical protein F2P79_006616 [Pimephales promelas]|nr:hypothetical protein F2P79_006616 [Pimephales promelas]